MGASPILIGIQCTCTHSSLYRMKSICNLRDRVDCPKDQTARAIDLEVQYETVCSPFIHRSMLGEIIEYKDLSASPRLDDTQTWKLQPARFRAGWLHKGEVRPNHASVVPRMWMDRRSSVELCEVGSTEARHTGQCATGRRHARHVGHGTATIYERDQAPSTSHSNRQWVQIPSVPCPSEMGYKLLRLVAD